MKKTALFSLCVLFFAFNCQAYDTYTATMRSNGLLRFIAKSESVRDFALFTVMYTRCKRYTPKPQLNACQDSVEKMLKTLDYDLLLNNQNKAMLVNEYDPESFVFVAFKTQLINLLNDQKTIGYLNLVNEKLTKFMTGEDRVPANLFELSVAYYGSEKLAVRALASLFQDTSPNKLHLAWLEKSQTRSNATFVENKELLGRVIDTINFIMDTSESTYRQMFYPPKIQKFINRNIYHLYVPYFLSQQLREQNLSAADATRGPLMMTLTYEFVTTSRGTTYLFDDPEKVSDQSILDIFAGYTGGRMGAGMDFMTLDRVTTAFRTSTTKGVQTILP